MHLGEKPLQQIVDMGDEWTGPTELLVACYSILESGIQYMVNRRFDDILDERQNLQASAHV